MVVNAIEDPDPASVTTPEERLIALAKEYAEARDLASEATARKEEAREGIIALMGRPGQVAAGGFVIKLTEQSRTTLDTKALRRWADGEGLDLSPYEKVSTTTVLRIA
jgi:hypothetical protein